MRSHNRRDVVRVLHALAFALLRARGRHDVFGHADGRLTAVPRHAIIPAGTCREIAREIRLIPETFDKMVRR
ncbi:MAG TPA: type II toxin-antitoxin system HicA family toxin [Candidatus Baltobacteraceae bacterium]|nr:type II toxin-antitoxin system HicA family toxin [Candidatus Baltobacteraceae bacterium]